MPHFTDWCCLKLNHLSSFARKWILHISTKFENVTALPVQCG